MANSSTNIPQLSFGMADKETQVNELFDAASPAMLYGRNALTTTALTWGYLGGRFNGLSIANGTIALTASTTNYIEADASTGAVSKSTTGWTTGKKPLYSIVTGASAVTSYQDFREASGGGLALPVAIAQGGTGATDAAGARANLGIDDFEIKLWSGL